jgi:hypothetical protein
MTKNTNIFHPLTRILAASAMLLATGLAAADVVTPPAVLAAATATTPTVKAAVVKAGSPGASIALNDPKCVRYVLTGTAPNQTITCSKT